MKRLILLLCCIVSLARGEDLYFTQSGSGSHDGTIGNPWGVAEASTPVHWGAGAGKISAGDTLHVVGTIGSPLVFQGSGTIGSTITLLFDSGAKFSAPVWNQSGVNHDAAIYVNGLSYITINGGSNGVIECTQNGTVLPFKLDCNGVYCGACSNIEIHHLTVRNLYIRTGSTDTNDICTGIKFAGGFTNVSIHHNVTSYGTLGLMFGYNGSSSNLSIYNNTCTAHSIGIRAGNENSTATLDTVNLYNNDVSQNAEWTGVPSIHTNCVHLFSVGASSLITNLRVYNNYFHGNMGTFPTSLLFLEGYDTAPLVYSNVFYHVDFVGGNGDFTIKGSNGLRVMNNTFVSNTPGSFTAIGVTSWADTETFVAYNNLILDYNFAFYDPVLAGHHSIAAADYNDCYTSTGGVNFKDATMTLDRAGWLAAGYDAHGIAAAPNLVSYVPQTGSPVIGAGLSQATYFTDDAAGVAWATAWGIGAYKSVSASAGPVITLNPITQFVTTGATVTFTVNASGSPAPTWQWNKNASPIGGATNSSLVLSSVTNTDNGSYTATATNASGAATSAAAVLTVSAAPSPTTGTPGTPVITGIVP